MTPSEAEVANPFALLMNPEVVLKAIESSERLSRLHSRICRPLDRAIGPVTSTGSAHSFSEERESAGDDAELPEV